MKPGDKAAADRFGEYGAVHAAVLPGKKQRRQLLFQIKKAENGGQHLGEDGGSRGAADAGMQSPDKQAVQQQIDTNSRCQRQKGCLGATGGTQKGAVQVIEKGDGKPGQNNAQIPPDKPGEGVRHLNEGQHGLHQEDPGAAQQGGNAKPHDQGEKMLLPESLPVLGTEILGQKDGNAGASAYNGKQKEIHNGTGDACGCKLCAPGKVAENEYICGVVQLLQQIAHDKRRCQPDEVRRNRAICQIICVCHVEDSCRLMI